MRLVRCQQYRYNCSAVGYLRLFPPPPFAGIYFIVDSESVGIMQLYGFIVNFVLEAMVSKEQLDATYYISEVNTPLNNFVLPAIVRYLLRFPGFLAETKIGLA